MAMLDPVPKAEIESEQKIIRQALRKETTLET